MDQKVLLYTSPGCPSCRKAKRWLHDNHISFIEKNIFSNLISESEIKYLLSRCENGTDDLISKLSKAYRSIEGDVEEMSLHELTNFILTNPSILRRPILLSERSIVIGYDPEELTVMIPLSQRKQSHRAMMAVGSAIIDSQTLDLVQLS